MPLLGDQMDLLRYPEAAQLLNIPLGTLYAWVSEKKIPHIRLSGRSVRFERAQLEQWIAERRVQPIEQFSRRASSSSRTGGRA